MTTLLHGVHRSDDENERRRRRERVAEQLEKNYYYDDGVAKWPIVYPIATSGRRQVQVLEGKYHLLLKISLLTHFQSPINLVPSKAKADPALRPLEISYSEGCVKSISNTGNSWKANVDDAKASNMRV